MHLTVKWRDLTISASHVRTGGQWSRPFTSSRWLAACLSLVPSQTSGAAAVQEVGVGTGLPTVGFPSGGGGLSLEGARDVRASHALER